ncbi:tRNA glutamyl-Q(34) synthetase GluQRS [Algisphaera agarilytica]|uniref:Glutamyl-tRNA synthetase n=1 Tax=Algisphaera agarilytica TaxID=1385975 RepID=A0A7X0H8X4_9BACT|nr:tRNA glutamyl-Q(34) synthetase GluQRS [Algisphaera agarilytica]MBB6431450.1 glutamyl-tRNA synthetase [Algisphaera agarilytica]
MTDRVTRLAPSPTGALHLGNMRTFLINWAAARQNGWAIVMRIEDLDGPRVKPEASQQAIDILDWLGMDWDGEAIFQSHDLSRYEEALGALSRKRLTYRCPATRSEILAAASAPHVDDHEQRYPGLYRPENRPADAPPIPEEADTAIRVIVPEGEITFVDELHGPQAVDVQQQVGDFIVQTKAGLPSYQLAVVVDDDHQGVTDIVRGDDLLRSTARQVFLQDALGLSPRPRYYHVPLVLGEDGHRLAKRHGDTRTAMYREQGVRPERIVGLLAWWCGLTDTREELAADEFLRTFDWAKLSPDPIIFTPDDHQWLMQNT